jgi:hypothetical protein
MQGSFRKRACVQGIYLAELGRVNGPAVTIFYMS